MTPDEVWLDFCDRFVGGRLTREDCRPLVGEMLWDFLERPGSADTLKQFLAGQPIPKSERAGDKLIFWVPSGDDWTFRFDFLLADDRWYLFTFECVTLPIKEVTSLPFTDFPGLPKQEDWIRQEFANSERIRFLSRLAKERGFDEALEWFRDGAGYVVGAQAWVPYFPAPRAFVVYACWIESNIQGIDVSLEEFTDDRCVILFRDHQYFQLYDRSGHIAPQISREDHRRFFEFVWQDRAGHAGWDAAFAYGGYDVTMMLTSRDDQPES